MGGRPQEKGSFELPVSSASGGDIAVNPAATEVCADGIDNDCSGDATGCILTGAIELPYFTGDYDLQITGRYAADFLGASVTVADLSGDDVDDLVVGATGYAVEASSGGAVFVMAGPVTSGSTASAAATILGTVSGDAIGGDTVSPGDLDGDGYHGLIVSTGSLGFRTFLGPLSGSFDMTASDGEGALGLAGPLSGSLGFSDADAWREGESSGDQLGMSVTHADLNDDGIEDLMLAAPNEDEGELDAGAAYVVLGPITGSMGVSTAEAKLLSSNSYQQIGLWGWQGRS